jgi:hypothetical protein
MSDFNEGNAPRDDEQDRFKRFSDEIDRMSHYGEIADQLAQIGYSPAQLVQLFSLSHTLLGQIHHLAEVELADYTGIEITDPGFGTLQRIRDILNWVVDPQDDNLTIQQDYMRAWWEIFGPPEQYPGDIFH